MGLQSFLNIVTIIINWIIYLAPVGVCFLVAAEIVVMKDVAKTFEKLAWLFATVNIALVIHGLFILPLMYWVITRELPFTFMKNMTPALATAFGTSSSSASLPVTLDNLINKNNIDKRIAQFVLPIGATVNMDGSAMYEAVAALFVAQLNGIDLGIGKVIASGLVATLISIGVAGMPASGLFLVMVLKTLGLPLKDVGLILTIDWLLDRTRTTVNVLGDAYGAAILAKVNKGQLEKIDRAKADKDVAKLMRMNNVNDNANDVCERALTLQERSVQSNGNIETTYGSA